MGKCTGIRIPKTILQELDIHVNDYCTITMRDQQLILEKAVKHRTLEERAAEYGNTLGPYSEFDWGDPEGCEVW